MGEISLNVTSKDVTGVAIIKQAWFDGGNDDYSVDACIGITGTPTIILSVSLADGSLNATHQIDMPQIIEQLIESLKTKKEQDHVKSH